MKISERLSSERFHTMELLCVIAVLIKDCARLEAAAESNSRTSLNTSPLTVLRRQIALTGLVRRENIIPNSS